MTRIAQLIEELAVQTVEGDKSGPPLLNWLRVAVWGADVTRSRSGVEGGMIPLNASAFTLWEDITGQVAVMFMAGQDLRVKPYRDPEANLLAWWALFSAETERGSTTPVQLDVAEARVARWVERIRAHFAPQPVTGWELMVPCPECGVDRATSGDGELAAEAFVLVPEIITGELQVRCTNCGARWFGPVEVIHLGRTVGVPIDVDAIRDAQAPRHAEPSGGNETGAAVT